MQKVNLRQMPYFLNDKDINWVEETINEMTLEEKIGQLFIALFLTIDSDEGIEFLRKFKLGGARYMNKPSKPLQKFLGDIQNASKIPLLIAANLDQGGSGAMSDGTYVASAAQAEASGDTNVARSIGYVGGVEATAIGCNLSFNPVVDLVYNWRNTIVNTRSFGKDPDTVIKHADAFIKGIRESGMAVTAKHFPGDGSEERDQHLVLGVNEFTVDEWDNTFGKVYKHMIDSGIEAIMAGHIALPEYQYKLNPELTYDDIMPATLAPELLDGLLKTQLNFNGLVVTDASHMAGMAAAMPRSEYIPKSIAAGCDMFLFFNDPEEDFNYMLNGYKNGIITDERLHDALRRILGLKAKLQLHTKKEAGTLVPDPEKLDLISCDEHLELAKDAADLGISLIKDTKNQLPITPETHPRIRLHTLFGEIGGLQDCSNNTEALIVEELERVGFQVTVNDGTTREKGSVEKLKQDFDAALIFADIVGYAAENNYRIKWKCAMSTDMPWYVYELPTVFVSLNYTTHLTDVPMVKTYINAYKDTREIIRQTIQKMMGKSEFKGQNFNDNVWCDLWETRR